MLLAIREILTAILTCDAVAGGTRARSTLRCGRAASGRSRPDYRSVWHELSWLKQARLNSTAVMVRYKESRVIPNNIGSALRERG